MNTKFQKILINALTKVDDPKLMEDLLSNLLTPGELEEVATRLQIFIRLIDKKSQREISEELNVSIATVTRGSRELKYGKPGFSKLWR